MTLRVGIAGYGRRGRLHAEALGDVPGAVVVAVSDPVADSRSRAVAELPGVATYADAAEMSARGGVDAIVIASPAHLNGVVAADVVWSGKPILVEKPPAMSSYELEQLVQAATCSGSRVMVAFNRRFNSLVRAAIAAVRETGPVIQIVAEFHKDIHDFTDDPRFSAGIFDFMLLESPIHSIDLITHIADSPVASVDSIVKRVASPYRDVHAALIEFANGVVCQFSSAYTAGGRLERYEIHGEYVSAYLDGVNTGWLMRGNARVELDSVHSHMADLIAQDTEFVRAVREGRDFGNGAATLESSFAVMELCERILAGTK